MKTKIIHITSPLLAAAALALGAVSTAHADYESSLLSLNPVGYWRLNETTAPPAPTPAANSGSLAPAAAGVYTNWTDINLGQPGAIVGDANTAGNLPGLVDGTRIRVPYEAALNPSAAFTVEFWAKPGQTAAIGCPAAFVEFIADGSNKRNGWLIYQGNAALTTGNGYVFRLYNTSNPSNAFTAATASFPLDTAKYYHVVAVYDGSSAKMYTNGVLAMSTAMPGGSTYRPTANTAIPLTFGARADGTSGYFTYNGTLDEPAIYATALSAGQILTHYQNGTNALRGAAYPTVVQGDGALGYWRLGEGGSPVAANIGSLVNGNGGYVAASAPGQVGPVPPSFGGFAANNKATSFNGAAGFVSLPAWNLNTNRVTMTAWVKGFAPQPGDAGIVFARGGGTLAGLRMLSSGNTFGYNWNDAPATTTWDSTLALPADKWTFVALIVEPDKATIAMHDGSSFSKSVNTATHVLLNFAGPARIGSDSLNATRTFSGLIDEVAVFNQALTLSQVYGLYVAAVGGNFPPEILSQPEAPTLLYRTETLTLTVQAGGSSPLSYQWRKDSGSGPVPIPGATTSVYSKVVNVAVDDGTYDVVVTNAYGTVTSVGTYVFVQDLQAPAITDQPQSRTVYAGGTLDLSVSASGGNLRYQWYKAASAIAGATNSRYTIASVVASNAATYKVTVTNILGSLTSADAVLTVTTPVTNSYEGLVVADAPEAWWQMNETGSGPLADSMGRHDGNYTGSGQTFGVTGAIASSPAINKAVSFDGETSKGYARIPFSTALNGTNFTLEVWAKVTAFGNNRSCPVSSFTANSGQPLQGKGYGFDIDTTGLWQALWGANADGFLFTIVPIGAAQLAQWEHLVYTYNDGELVFWRNGVRYPEPGFIYNSQITRNVSADMLIAALEPGNGSYDYYFNGVVDDVAYYPRVLTDAQILAHYNTALYGVGSAPTVSLTPTSQTVIVGTGATIVGTVGGTPPVNSQWWFGGSPLAAQTNATLTLSALSFPQAGAYQLRATNTFGNASASASIVVMPQPQFVNATNGLVLHLPFNGDTADASGRANNGTPMNSPTYVAGQIGAQAIQVVSPSNGVSASYVTLGLRPDLQFGSSVNFSVSFWLKFAGLAGDVPIFGNAIGAMNNPGYCFAPGFYNGGWQWGLGSQTYAGTTVNNDQWHNMVAVFDRSGNATTYLDGVQVNSRVLSALNLDTAVDTVIGQDPTGSYPQAATLQIDDLGVWRRTLTSYEAYSIYYVGQNYGRSFDTVAPVQLQIQKTPTGVALVWQAGTLLQAPDLTGPWTPVAGAVAPYYVVSPAAGNKFYRASN